MKEKLISLDTAKLAKEKGFDEGVWFSYSEDGKLNNMQRNIKPYTNGGKYISCCTLTFLQQWLRETHNIYVISNVFSKAFVDKANQHADGIGSTIKYKENFADVFKIEDDGKSFTNTRTIFGDSYDDALELGLQFALSRI